MFVEKSSDFTPTPAGVHKAVCSRFVDLGTHEDNGQFGQKIRREVMISWEIPEHRVEIDGKSLPVIHNQYYTWSMGEKANLRNALESWRGRAFTPDDLRGPPNGFNTKNLIGVGCLLHIMHNENGKAKIKGIMPLKKDEWPKLEGEPLYFQMQDHAAFDREAFDRLSDFHKGKIMGSPEWGMITGQERPQNETHGRDNGNDFTDDSIPF